MSSKLLFKYVKTNPYFYAVMVNRSCYRKLLIPLCTFLKFHTHLEQNLARSFHNVFDKCSRVLNLIFRKSNFSRKSPYFRIPLHLKAIKYDFYRCYFWAIEFGKNKVPSLPKVTIAKVIDQFVQKSHYHSRKLKCQCHWEN